MAAPAGCSSGATSSTATTSTTASAAALRGVTRAPSPFERFEQVRVTIRGADGEVRTPCMLLARTEELRAQGLMHVRAGGLDPFAGMVFAFDQDVTGSFTMADTVMPLSVVFLDPSGRVVSSQAMTPCPAGTTTCPTYPAAGPYRTAIEVPAGQATVLGLDEKAEVQVGGTCPT